MSIKIYKVPCNGLDISCNVVLDDKKDSFCGILIRSIQNEETKQIIEGPCKTVNEILACANTATIKDLVIDNFGNDLSCIKHNSLKLEEKNFDDIEVFVGPRIGLSMKGDDQVIEEKKLYLNRNYRYIAFKNGVKKGKRSLIKL